MNPVTFSALAEPHRLDIIELLIDKPRSVGEIVEDLKLNQPQVSKHLKVLHRAKLVDMEKRAQQRIYTINTQSIQDLEGWIGKMKKRWEKRFERLDRLFEAEKTKIK